MTGRLPDYLLHSYEELKDKIRNRLREFSEVPENQYFYELCFCICTPQSKAANALIVQQDLQMRNFYQLPFDASHLLRRAENYIRFHNTKAVRLLEARERFSIVNSILNSKTDNFEKRNLIAATVKGIGMKEASHFMRNIGYSNLAILDRHILRHIVLCGLYDTVPNVASRNNYLEVEKVLLNFSKDVKVPADELDLLFWSYETGEILK